MTQAHPTPHRRKNLTSHVKAVPWILLLPGHISYEMDWVKACRVLTEDEDSCRIHIRWEMTLKVPDSSLKTWDYETLVRVQQWCMLEEEAVITHPVCTSCQEISKMVSMVQKCCHQNWWQASTVWIGWDTTSFCFRLGSHGKWRRNDCSDGV